MRHARVAKVVYALSHSENSLFLIVHFSMHLLCVCVHSFALEDYLTAHSIPCYGLDGDNIRTGECLAAISRMCVHSNIQLHIPTGSNVRAIITFVVVLLYNIVAMARQIYPLWLPINAFFA